MGSICFLLRHTFLLTLHATMFCSSKNKVLPFYVTLGSPLVPKMILGLSLDATQNDAKKVGDNSWNFKKSGEGGGPIISSGLVVSWGLLPLVACLVLGNRGRGMRLGTDHALCSKHGGGFQDKSISKDSSQSTRK